MIVIVAHSAGLDHKVILINPEDDLIGRLRLMTNHSWFPPTLNSTWAPLNFFTLSKQCFSYNLNYGLSVLDVLGSPSRCIFGPKKEYLLDHFGVPFEVCLRFF